LALEALKFSQRSRGDRKERFQQKERILQEERGGMGRGVGRKGGGVGRNGKKVCELTGLSMKEFLKNVGYCPIQFLIGGTEWSRAHISNGVWDREMF
jgi:hypothetical protein